MTLGYWLGITEKLVVVSNYNYWDNQIISKVSNNSVATTVFKRLNFLALN